MAAGLKRDIEGPAAGPIPRFLNRPGFGMGSSHFTMVTDREDAPLLDQHRPNHGVGGCSPFGRSGQVKRFPHKTEIVRIKGHKKIVL